MRQKILSDIRREVDENTTCNNFCEDKEYSVSQLLYRFDTWTNAKIEAGLDINSLQCPNCDTHSQYISNHWNKCGEPKLSEKQKTMIKGMVLSDGTVNENGALTSYSSNKEFIEWFSDELGFMAYSANLNDKGEERHKRNIRSGFDERRDASYKDVYAVSSPIHSFTESLRNWYKSGEKEISDDLEVTKNLLKIWYCGDGGLNWSGDDRAYSEIRPLSFDNKIIKELINQTNFKYKVQSDGTVCFYSDTDKFLDYISPAPKGMEYKWENKDREIYNKLKP